MLEQVVKGAATTGLRARLLQKYDGYRNAHDLVEAAITPDQLRDCARYVLEQLTCCVVI